MTNPITKPHISSARAHYLLTLMSDRLKSPALNPQFDRTLVGEIREFLFTYPDFRRRDAGAWRGLLDGAVRLIAKSQPVFQLPV